MKTDSIIGGAASVAKPATLAPDDDPVGMVSSLLNGAMALYTHHEPRERIMEHITKATCYFDEKASWSKAGEKVSSKAVRKTIAYIVRALHDQEDHPTPCVRALLLEAQRLLVAYDQPQTTPDGANNATADPGITWGTEFAESGPAGTRLAVEATYDIAHLSETLIARANTHCHCDIAENRELYVELRMFYARIAQLNDAVMHFISGGDMSLEEAYRALYGEDPVGAVEAA